MKYDKYLWEDESRKQLNRKFADLDFYAKRNNKLFADERLSNQLEKKWVQYEEKNSKSMIKSLK